MKNHTLGCNFFIPRTLACIGMMGSGKTTIGKKIADISKVPFYDLDKEIEKDTGLSISFLFKEYGEVFFREKEYIVLKSLLREKKHPCVLSLGGGAFINPLIRTLLKEWKVLSLWIKADPTVLWERVRYSTRPLIQKEKAEENFYHLLKKGEKIYAEADLMIINNSGNILSSAKTVTKMLRFFC